MSGCTFILARNSPLRTTLVDEVTGHAKYKIDTPIRLTGSVTRIRKLDPHTHPYHWDDDSDSDSDDGIADKKKYEYKKDEKDEEAGDETTPELPETSDEMARIYWKWLSSNEIVFRGRTTTRNEFLPKSGKMKGQVVSRRVSLRKRG